MQALLCGATMSGVADDTPKGAAEHQQDLHAHTH